MVQCAGGPILDCFVPRNDGLIIPAHHDNLMGKIIRLYRIIVGCGWVWW